jgi:DegV family protein with EDD domain
VIGLVTDSNSQIPPELVERYDVEVVPLTVVVDGEEHAEGVDLDADAFYARFAGGRTPEVSTSQPSPGAFVAAYERAAARGADQILSIHIGAAVSGTLNAATLAAAGSPVPVRLVDSGTASFGITCCLWQAAEALRAGADIEAAAAVAERTAATVGNVFVVRALDLARRGGRVAVAEDTGEAVPVLTLVGGSVEVVATVDAVDDAAAAMARYVLDHAELDGLRVAVGYADAAGAPLSDALHDLVAADPRVAEVVRYRVGPSVGVHTGPGTAGAFFF